MRSHYARTVLAACLAAAVLTLAAAPARAGEPVALRWEQLVPGPGNARLAKLLERKPAAAADMSSLSDLVMDYDGARVSLEGFVVPLSGAERPLKEFLLIPFAGSCVKFPPDRNQAVLVTVPGGADLEDFFDPVTVTGTLTVAPTPTSLVTAGYQIAAESVKE